MARVALVLASLLTAISLGVHGAQPSPPAPDRPSPADTAAQAALPSLAPSPFPTSSPPPSIGGQFARRDVPPGDVARFLEFGVGGGGECVDPEDGRPDVRFDTVYPTERDPLGFAYGIPTEVCAVRMTPGVPVTLTMRREDRETWSSVGIADRSGAASWDLDDLAPPIGGTYLLEARQGQVVTRATYQVELLSLDAVVVPASVRVGGAARLVIAGGVPGQTVSAYLYRVPRRSMPGREAVFVTDLETIGLDGHGEARAEVRPRHGDPQGRYVLVLREPVEPLTPDSGRTGPPHPPGGLPLSLEGLLTLASSLGMACDDSLSDWVFCDGSGAIGGLYAEVADGWIESVTATIPAPGLEASAALRFLVNELALGAAAEAWLEAAVSGARGSVVRTGDVWLRRYRDESAVNVEISGTPIEPDEAWAEFTVRREKAD